MRPQPPSGEWATFRRALDLPGVETLAAHYVTHRYMPHVHDKLALALIEGGAEGFRYRGAQRVALPGQLAIVQAGEPHTGEAATAGGWMYRVLYLDPAWFSGEGLSPTGGFAEAVVNDPELAALVRRAHRALAAPTATSLAREALLRGVLALLIRRYADARPPGAPLPDHRPDHWAVRQVQALLDASPETALNLSDLSVLVGLSPAHLARSFRQVVGMPPHTYQMLARVRLARDLLHEGVPPADAALRSGFADQAHLTRVFKRVVGVPPGAYVRDGRA
ncbi:AraC family transcriptional regulator [Deinococcus carri]|uniref:AraC family transcriptional regulator n=1 Tax=Deinococcus carri TaxID=1211323 RepID=UPI0031E999B1